MYFPFRHDVNTKESMHTSSTSNHPDSTSTGRPFAASFSDQIAPTPNFQNSGLNNMHGSYNIPNMPTALSSRNSGLGGVPSGGVHQPTGNLSSGRYTSNNIPAALSQLSHGGLHGHSGITSRGGISVVGNHNFSSGMNGVGGSVPGGSASGSVGNRGSIQGMGASPLAGNVAPRISSSVGNIAVGGGANSNLGRTLSGGGGLAVPGLTNRVNNGSGGISIQGPGRPISTILQQGNTYSSSGGTMVQGQAQSVNGQLSSMGLSKDESSSDSVPFDMNDFPQLTARHNTSGVQGQLASLRKQGFGINSIVQHSQEFSIQNEDFPALPGFKGGNADFVMDLQQKEHHHENAMAMMQAQQFPMVRSAGFAMGGSYVSHHQPQQQQQQQQASGLSSKNVGAAFLPRNSPDLFRLHGSDLFPSSPGISASHYTQVIPSLRSGGPNSTAHSLGSYDQLLQQYQHHQNQSQFRLQQISAFGQAGRDQGFKQQEGLQATADRFGLLGLLDVVNMVNPPLRILDKGIDTSSFGFDLNSPPNLYKTFGSPWSDEPAKVEPEYRLPQCYIQKAPKLHQGYFSKFQEETLFYIFYSMPNDEAQLYAANELYNRGWFYHKELQLWCRRVPNVEPLLKTNTYEQGSFLYFDPETWKTQKLERPH